jgi:hypothetical protein
MTTKQTMAPGLLRLPVLLAILCYGLIFPNALLAQQGSDVYVGKINLFEKQGVHSLEKVSDNAQYSNQPYFFGHDHLFFTQAVKTGDAEQMDIFKYHLLTSSLENHTNSAQSEYSPTPLPNGKGMSVIRVNSDGKQELWRLDGDGNAVEHLVPAIEPVGYQVWLNQHELLLFVLGEPHTLQRVDIRKPSASGKVIDRNIGASLYRFEQSDWYLYSAMEENEESSAAKLKAFNAKTNEIIPITNLPANSSYFSITPTGHIITSDGETLFQKQVIRKGERLDSVSDWTAIILPEGKCSKGISRTNVAKHGGLIALVCPH